MNLFQKYGIKEVADVVFYSITTIGDEEFYTPVLFLDTLKVSTVEKSAEKVTANGGYGNKKLIAWNFGKDIKLNLEDALFTPASMSMIWGGQLNSKLSIYTSAIAKINIANKYGRLHYSTKAYPSPAFTNEEWELIYRVATEIGLNTGAAVNDTPRIYWEINYRKNKTGIEENRTRLRKLYLSRTFNSITNLDEEAAMPQSMINALIKKITSLKKIGSIETDIYDLEIIDRMEKCVVKDRNGLKINVLEQKNNLLKYYQDDKTSSYVIYYDAKTMLPLLSLAENGAIQGWDNDDATFKIKIGTVYYKWTRTVKYKSGINNGILGKTLVIDADTFPDTYKIVGETYIREQKTGRDQRYQFTIHRAQVSSDTNITLQADGDPTTFSMNVDVLVPPNDIMIELKQFDVDEDNVRGGTRVIPQKSRYTYTPTVIELKEKVDFTNDEIY